MRSRAIAPIVVVLLASPSVAGQATATGTAVVSGVVVMDDPGRLPLRLATVRLSRAGADDVRLTSTDDQGRYRFTDLPTGTYSLRFTKGAYLSLEYGAPRPGLPGSSFALDGGQSFAAKPVALFRGGVIGGRVVDPAGRPVDNLTVRAMQFISVDGVRMERSVAATSTNEHGEYRMFGLLPGEYVVAAGESWGSFSFQLATIETTAAEIRWAESRTGARPEPGRRSGRALTFFPGTSDSASASPIALARGEERTGVNITMQTVPVARIAGTVTGADGRPGAKMQVFIIPKRAAPFATRPVTATTDVAGAFAFNDMPPGEHRITAIGGQARAEPRAPAAGGRPQWGFADVSMSGRDVGGVAIALQDTGSVSGRVIVSGASQPQWRVTAVRVQLLSTDALPAVPDKPPAVVGADGTFTIDGLIPGSYRARVIVPVSPGTAWSAKSAVLGERDLLDVAGEVRAGERAGELVVTIGDAQSQVDGRLTDAQGRPAGPLYALAFPTNTEHWRAGSRRIQFVRSDEAGAYAIRGLPAGEYFFCALTDVDPQLIFAASQLSPLAARSTRLTVADGQPKTVDLRTVR